MPDTQVVTRFAPSPTGQLHVGGARTALFNWAFARHHGGRFVLRMEDTDRARSTAESTRAILHDLQWLAMDWDEGPDPSAEDPYAGQIGEHGPYFQSQRLKIYQRYVDQLIEQGRAYKCFQTPEELAAGRERARAEKRAVTYDPTPSRSLTSEQIADLEAQGKPFVVRFAMPNTSVDIQDEVLGLVSVQPGQIDDFVILKSDGFPTYHLAVVVDDSEMGVTHVIRGQEHLNNAPKHTALQDALGFDRPQYAHIPLIFNPDGSKMSKRDKAKVARSAAKEWLKDHNDDVKRLAEQAGIEPDALARFIKKKNDDIQVTQALAHPGGELDVTLPAIDVDDFRRNGYLADTLMNYLALLGWSPGQNIERFDRDFLVQQFSLDRVGKANARFDREKLASFNGQSIADMTPTEFTNRLKCHLEAYHRDFYAKIEDRFELFAQVYQPRSRTLDDPVHLGQFLITPQINAYDPKAVKKFLAKNDGQGFQTLKDLQEPLETCRSNWNQTTLEQTIDKVAQEHGLGLNQLAQPLRIALSGSTVTPPIYDTLVLMGPDRTLQRIKQCEPDTLETST